jgi:hypothetical protein
MPLPSRSTSHWIYNQLSNLPELETRKHYLRHCVPMRVQRVRQQIEDFRPSVVVFYSFNSWYRQWWEAIAGNKFSLMQTDKGLTYFSSRDAHTRYFIIRHPVSVGVTNDYYDWIGEQLFS